MKDNIKLSFTPENDFTLMQFTDLHYGENHDWDKRSDEILTTTINHQKHTTKKLDAAILTGDPASGYAWDGHTRGWYEQLWRQFTAPFAKFKLPYLYALGNHDPQGDLNRTEVMALDRTHEWSMSVENKDPDVALASNYVVPIYDADDSDDVAFYLWAFDSGSDDCMGRGISGWGCVEPSQVEWYRRKSQELRKQNNGRNVPGMAFYHIPHPEFMGNDGVYDKFKFNGVKQEPISCFSINTGIYAAFSEQKNIQTVVVGHDHHNWLNFTSWDPAITMVYGKKTGWGGYGPLPGVQVGTTVFTLKKTGRKVSVSSDVLFEDLTYMGAKMPVNQHFSTQTQCAGMKTSKNDKALSIELSNCHRYHEHFEAAVRKWETERFWGRKAGGWYHDTEWYEKDVRATFAPDQRRGTEEQGVLYV